MWQQWTNTVIGVVLFLVPFLLPVEASLFWILMLSGLAVAVLGVWGAQETNKERASGRMSLSH